MELRRPSRQDEAWKLESWIRRSADADRLPGSPRRVEKNNREKIDLGLKAISFWTDVAQIKDGPGAGLMKTRYDYGAFQYDTVHYPIFLRTMNDGYEGILDAARLVAAYAEDARYADYTYNGLGLTGYAGKFSDACDLYAQFLVNQQNEDGSYYRAYRHTESTKRNAIRGAKSAWRSFRAIPKTIPFSLFAFWEECMSINWIRSPRKRNGTGKRS